MGYGACVATQDGSGTLRYHFEDCTLDTDRRELRRGCDLVPVEPQVFDLLVYVIRNRERVVSRDDLLASIWHGRIVSESTLNTRISAARFAIGDNGEDQRLIKTLPRKGVRFVGSVREDQRPAEAVARQPIMATQHAGTTARNAVYAVPALQEALDGPTTKPRELEHTARIRELNDALRTANDPLGVLLARGQLLITRGVASHGNDFIARALQTVRAFNDFSEDNDPYGEHDFGSFTLDGEMLFWKIDLYERELVKPGNVARAFLPVTSCDAPRTTRIAKGRVVPTGDSCSLEACT